MPEKNNDNICPDYWFYPQKWRNISTQKLARLSDKQTSYMRIRNSENAKSDAAQKLINDRQPIAKRYQPESNGQVVVKMIVTGVGAVMYVTVASIFASNLGKVRVPVSLVGGAILSFMVDKLATRAITNKGIQENARIAIQAVEEEKKSNTSGKDNEIFPLKIEYSQEKIQFIRDIESPFLQDKSPTNTIGAIALNTVEFGTAFWLMSNVTIFGGGIPFFVKPLVSSLPVLFTWGFAIYQKDAFELPKHYGEQMPVYEQSVFPQPNTSSNILMNKQREDFLVDAEINNILSPNPTDATPEIARDKANINYCRNMIRQLEKSRKQEILERQKQRQKDLDNLPSQYPSVEEKTQGQNVDQIEEIKRKWEMEKQEWLKTETVKLEKTAENDINTIKEAYQLEINVWQQQIKDIESTVYLSNNKGNHKSYDHNLYVHEVHN